MIIKLYDFQGELVQEFKEIIRYVGYKVGEDMFLDVYYSVAGGDSRDRHIRCSDYLNIEVTF